MRTRRAAPRAANTACGRRALALGAIGALGTVAFDARAFGDDGAFHPRVLIVGGKRFEGVRATGPARWSDELVRRTSAPARLRPATVRADEPAVLAEPFLLWPGTGDIPPLLPSELRMLRRFFAMGGVLFVDDENPRDGGFSRATRREIARVLPEQSPIAIGPENVVFRSFYLLRAAVGRVSGPPKLEAIVRGGAVQVIFGQHDLLGALARGPTGVPSMQMETGGELGREHSIRLAVNVAMYVLCSTYKDDQVHAEHLMRRRGAAR